jgi:hypothetical protein
MDNELAALLSTAAAKAAAHSGLSAALEYGTVRALRVNGLDHLYATSDGRTHVVTVNVNGRVECAGYVVSSTCRDLAYVALAAYRNR